MASKRAFLWAGLSVAGLVLVGTGIWWGITRLDDADRWGSVIGSLVAVLGFPMAIYAFVLSHRSGSAAEPPGAGQSAAHNTVGGDIHQIHDVGGDVNIGGPPRRPAPPGPGREADQ